MSFDTFIMGLSDQDFAVLQEAVAFEHVRRRGNPEPTPEEIALVKSGRVRGPDGLTNGDFVRAVKSYRTRTNSSLITAKRVMDAVVTYG